MGGVVIFPAFRVDESPGLFFRGDGGGVSEKSSGLGVGPSLSSGSMGVSPVGTVNALRQGLLFHIFHVFPSAEKYPVPLEAESAMGDVLELFTSFTTTEKLWPAARGTSLSRLTVW